MAAALGLRKLCNNVVHLIRPSLTASSQLMPSLHRDNAIVFRQCNESSGPGFRLVPSHALIPNGMPGCLQIRTMATAGRSGRPLKYKVRKGRCSKGFKADGSHLSFGTYGIKCCENGRISSRAIEAARRAIIGQFKRKGKVWIRVLADIPITKKPTEVRMGRGKGNVAGWIARVSTGQVLFEMDGVSLADAKQAATLASHKLCLPTKFMIYS